MQPADTRDMPISSAQADTIHEASVEGITRNKSSLPVVSSEGRNTYWLAWYDALKNAFPVYFAVHLASFVITCLAVLFTMRDFWWGAKPLYTLWQSWHRWDTGVFTTIALHGYRMPQDSAFFPLYPLLERVLMPLFHNNPFLPGLLIANVADLGLLIVLYRLVKEDFNVQRAERTILYLSIFPTAFFLIAAYNESLFLFLSLLSFYQMRHSRWWLAGLFGIFACLTRSAGLLLLIPFCYEYLRQHEFKLRNIRFDVVSSILIPVGVGIFAIYCYFQFHDLLAFSHAQAHWQRNLQAPWDGILFSINAITHSRGFLGFTTLRNLTDLVPDLLFLALVILLFVGPWKLLRQLWAYGFYAVALYIFFQLFPDGGTGLFPLESISRFMLEIFPGFIILAALGKNRAFNLSYLMVSSAVFFFLLTQFLTDHWVI